MAERTSADGIRAFAAARRFSATTVERWLRFAERDRVVLLRLAERLRLGENQFRDLLDWSEEIAVRERCSVADVWQREALTSVLARPLGRNEMIVAVKAALRLLRFPQLAAAEARLAELIRRLKLPRAIQVRLPEHLEGNEVRIELAGRSAAALRDHAAALQRALDAPLVEEIFRALEEAP